MLRTLRRPAEPAQRPERCALCGVRLSGTHRHLADTAERSLACACTPCALLFQRPGAAGGRYRPVPDRLLYDPVGAPGPDIWARLRIPVSTAFLLHNADRAQPVLCYPSPAGATESELSPATYEDVFGGSRLAAVLEPDVEALLLRRSGSGGSSGSERIECFLVPVDLCYELVGRMRRTWQGFDGGAEAHAELDAFFAAVDERARPLNEELSP
ncbi:DUF5947 family protein [Streptomyces sp. NPDC047315]|uniref:DUF5947 family protein n=1 Tax=Streptomyces sp. NPDC047315 TaxID=3155142 RepID=UPI0033E86265